MQSKFPFSVEKLPQSSGFFCLSLKFGAIVSGLVAILYSLLALAECGYALMQVSPNVKLEDANSLFLLTIIIVVTITNAVTFILSAALLVGVLKEVTTWIRPWIVWISFLTITYMLVFVFSSTVNMINHFSGSLMFYMVEFLVLVIRVYMLIIVSSYYRQLVAGEQSIHDGYTIIDKGMSYSIA